MESVENNQANQTAGPESHNSPGHNQGQRRWEPEEEAKEEQPPPEDEGSNSGVGVAENKDKALSCLCVLSNSVLFLSLSFRLKM